MIVLSLCAALAAAGCQTLSSAAYNDKYETARQLIDKGHDVNAHDRWGWTPLMWAAYYNHYSIARLLLEKGADANIGSIKEYKSFKTGTTALILAAYSGNVAIIRELMKYDADPSLENSQGISAFVYAEQYHGEYMLKLLKGGR
jgi:ankyrin repeat protein